jgi:hypothetical protein
MTARAVLRQQMHPMTAQAMQQQMMQTQRQMMRIPTPLPVMLPQQMRS